jgi:hypothetical protein
MTLDHAVLTGVWTVYIFIGSYLKDRRLTHYLGDAYRAYQAKVPGYPLVPFGPLGKVEFKTKERWVLAPKGRARTAQGAALGHDNPQSLMKP